MRAVILASDFCANKSYASNVRTVLMPVDAGQAGSSMQPGIEVVDGEVSFP